VPPDLSPSERTLRARAAALTLHSKVDSTAHLAPARAASPGQLAYWLAQVDPDGILDPAERERRADCARRAHMAKLALASSKARRRKAGTP
jgi:hypothetical protein